MCGVIGENLTGVNTMSLLLFRKMSTHLWHVVFTFNPHLLIIQFIDINNSIYKLIYDNNKCIYDINKLMFYINKLILYIDKLILHIDKLIIDINK